VPLASMFGYSTDLRSATQGRATYTMEFKHYADAPKNIADEVMAARSKEFQHRASPMPGEAQSIQFSLRIKG